MDSQSSFIYIGDAFLLIILSILLLLLLCYVSIKRICFHFTALCLTPLIQNFNVEECTFSNSTLDGFKMLPAAYWSERSMLSSSL